MFTPDWKKNLDEKRYPGLDKNHYGEFKTHTPSFWDNITGQSNNPINSSYVNNHNIAEMMRRNDLERERTQSTSITTSVQSTTSTLPSLYSSAYESAIKPNNSVEETLASLASSTNSTFPRLK